MPGLLAAATGVFVIPLGPYMPSLGLAKEEFIQGLCINFMIATVALVIRLGTANVDELVANIPGSATALIPGVRCFACVFPHLTVSQWVLFVPKRLRYFLQCGQPENTGAYRSRPRSAVHYPVRWVAYVSDGDDGGENSLEIRPVTVDVRFFMPILEAVFRPMRLHFLKNSP